MKTDIFISYRREGAKTEAILLYCKLREAGYNVFLDLVCMHSGEFTEEIKRTISSCTDVILLVSPNCFRRCEDPNDCFRQEIEWALKEEKKITQILVNQRNYPEKIPNSIQKLANMSAMEFPPMRHVDDLIRILQDPDNLKAQPRPEGEIHPSQPEPEERYEEDDGPDTVCRSCKSEDLSANNPLGFWLKAGDGFLRACILLLLGLGACFLAVGVLVILEGLLPAFREWGSNLMGALFPQFWSGFEDLSSMLAVLGASCAFGYLVPVMVAERFHQYQKTYFMRDAEMGYRWISYKCDKCGSKYKKRVKLYHVEANENNVDAYIPGLILLVILLLAAFLWNVMLNVFAPSYYGWIPILSVTIPVIFIKNLISNRINIHLEQIPQFNFLSRFFKKGIMEEFFEDLEEEEEDFVPEDVDTEQNT